MKLADKDRKLREYGKIEAAMANSDKVFKAKDAEMKALLEELQKTRNQMNELIAKNADLTQGNAVARGKTGSDERTRELQRREQQL